MTYATISAYSLHLFCLFIVDVLLDIINIYIFCLGMSLGRKRHCTPTYADFLPRQQAFAVRFEQLEQVDLVQSASSSR